MIDQLGLFEDDELLEIENQAEGLDDIGPINVATVNQSVVSGTDWTAETIISQINKGNIQLNPKFQRRDAWETKRKSSFIESLLLGLPIPQIVLAESKAKRGSYIVIDGKQRLLSIRQFAAKPDDPVYQQLRLSGLTIRKDLNQMTLESLRADVGRADDVTAFENQPIRTVVVKNWGTEDFLYSVFLRLNTGSVPLSTQELRQALHPGHFLEFIDEASAESAGLRKVLNLKKPDFRMRDAELLTRWYAFRNFGSQYRGDLKRFLDESCGAFNDNWEKVGEQVKADLTEFEASIETSFAIFKSDAFRKWTPVGYEGRFNRAIFDVMTFYFAEPKVRTAAIDNAELVEQAFKTLCETNGDFLAAIERTTKSIAATTERLRAWGEELTKLTGIKVNSPLPNHD